MSNEEFEDLFGNVPISDLKKIYEYLNKVFIPKEKIKDKIKELQEVLKIGKEEKSLSKEDIKRIEIEIKDLGSLLDE